MDLHYSKTSKQRTPSYVVCFVEWFSEVQNVLKLYRKQLFRTLKVSFVQRYVVLCPYLGGSTIEGFTIIEMVWLKLYIMCYV